MLKKEKNTMDILTKGDVIVNKIKIGDIQYEFEYGCCIRSRVIKEPTFGKNSGRWYWQNENAMTGDVIKYSVDPSFPQYAPNIYTSEVYKGCVMM